METFSGGACRRWRPIRRDRRRRTIRKSSSLKTPKRILNNGRDLFKRRDFPAAGRVFRHTWTGWSSEWHFDGKVNAVASQLQSPWNSWSVALSAHPPCQPRWIGTSRVSMPRTSYRPENVLQNNCQFGSLLIFAEMCSPKINVCCDCESRVENFGKNHKNRCVFRNGIGSKWLQ